MAPMLVLQVRGPGTLKILHRAPFFQNGAKSGFEICFGPSTLGAGAKTRLESRIKKFTPHCIYRYMHRERFRGVACAEFNKNVIVVDQSWLEGNGRFKTREESVRALMAAIYDRFQQSCIYSDSWETGRAALTAARMYVDARGCTWMLSAARRPRTVLLPYILNVWNSKETTPLRNG